MLANTVHLPTCQEQPFRLAHSSALKLSQIPNNSQRCSTLPDSLGQCCSAEGSGGDLVWLREVYIFAFFAAIQGGLCYLEWNRPGRDLPYEGNSDCALAIHFHFLFLLPSHTSFVSTHMKLLKKSRQCYILNYFLSLCLGHISVYSPSVCMC